MSIIIICYKSTKYWLITGKNKGDKKKHHNKHGEYILLIYQYMCTWKNDIYTTHWDLLM